MCVITDENDVVVVVSFTRGLGSIPEKWHVYFPVDDSPLVGSIYRA